MLGFLFLALPATQHPAGRVILPSFLRVALGIVGPECAGRKVVEGTQTHADTEAGQHHEEGYQAVRRLSLSS